MEKTEETQLSRNLSRRQVNMIALGGTIGTGLFLGAGESIQKAGPSILLVYIITGLFIFAMMRALGELLISDDSKPVFIDFMEKYLGPRAGFILGWTYWMSWIVIAMAELTAVGNYMHFWFPHVPTWPWEVGFLVVLYVVNIVAVQAFGETEFWFAMIKILAILAMIATGIMMAILHVKTSVGVTRFSTLWSHGLVANHGHDILSAFQMVFFAFLGVEFVGITAAETRDPVHTIPHAINSIVVRILIFYVGALAAIMTIQPWTDYSGNMSPFVQVFSGIGITGAAGIVNFVVLTAAASSLNSSLFTTGRMLYSLSNGHGYFSHLNHRAVPMRAVNLSTLLVGGTVIVNYIFPTDAFSIVTSVASATFLVVYGALMVTHLKFRLSPDYQKGRHLFRLPLSPYSNYLTIAFLAMIFVILLVTPATTVTTLLTVVWFAVLYGVSFLRKKA
ncbi:amino acid permease [Lactobacillaceae bacterium L1_55_11]|nr:amino acid permease [Lactobacillaceae bacterium L1_55_11]